MNQNTPPRKPQPPRKGAPQQRPHSSGLGQPVRRAGTPNSPRHSAPRPAPSNPSRPLIHPARTARRRRQRTVIMSILVVIILIVCMLIGLIFSELATAIGTMIERTGKD